TIGTPSGSNLTGDERVRYCIPQDTTAGSTAKQVLYGETQTWTSSTAPASPWSSDPDVTISCPDSPVPSGVGTPMIIASSVTNRYQQTTTHPAFTFNNGTAPSNLGQVFTVQLDLFVNPTPGQPSAAQSEIKSTAFLRNQPRAPVADFTSTPTGGGG